MKPITRFTLLFLVAAVTATVDAAPIGLNPQNSHYLLFRGQSTVLIGSSEHYAAVSNMDFDYEPYLDTVQADGLNAVRIFTGTFSEPPDTTRTKQSGNTLAHKPDRYLAPWPRSTQPGAADGQNKFDLSKWNEAFFDRLKAFVDAASKRGIVVEVTLFTPYYSQFDDYSWSVSPLNVRNNINNVGDIDGSAALTLQNGALLDIQDALGRKVTTELRDFDNVFYEICNEPFALLNVTPEWHSHMARVIDESENAFPARHLIAEELDPFKTPTSDPSPRAIERPLQGASLFLIHNLPDPSFVAVNYPLRKPLGFDENGLTGTRAATYRVQSWKYLMAGAAIAIGLDYSFTVGHEDGSFTLPANQIGGGGRELRKELGILHSFVKQWGLVNMAPATGVVKSMSPTNTSSYVLAQTGKSYVIYLSRRHRERFKGMFASAPSMVTAYSKTTLRIKIPAGAYVAKWLDPATGMTVKAGNLCVQRAAVSLTSPRYQEDTVLWIISSQSQR